MRNVDVAITLVFCLGVAWAAIRTIVWVIYGSIPSPAPASSRYWCMPKQVYCNASKCPCWDDEQEKRRAYLEEQRATHEDHPRHHA